MPPTIVEPPPPTAAAAAQPAQAARTELQLGKDSIAEPAKPGSAKERMFTELRKRVPNLQPEEPPKTSITAPAKPPEKKVEAPKAVAKKTTIPELDDEPAEETAEPTTEPTDDKTVDPKLETQTDPKGDKVKPWKVVEQYKERTSRLEKELADARGALMPEADRKTLTERMAKVEARNKELEDEIRYVNYEKSNEFVEKYHAPYEKAWKAAVAELAEIPVTDQNGVTRPTTGEDLYALCNLPLAKAKELAEAAFGNLAPEVMHHRMELKKLAAQRADALDTARKSGFEREKQTAEQQQKTMTEISRVTTELWEKANAEAVKDEVNGKYFSPVEGDAQGNATLAKGFEMVDRSMRENSLDPSLTAEQRAAIIRRHAAVRNRAASWGRLKMQNRQLSEKISELEKELTGFKGSEPGTTGTTASGAPPPPATAWGRMQQELRKLAK